MHTLTLILNGEFVDVHFTFDKGYEATFDDPGCPDDCEVHHVYYKEIDILPIMHEDDLEELYNYIYNCEGEDDE